MIIKSCYCYFCLGTYDLNAVNISITAGPFSYHVSSFNRNFVRIDVLFFFLTPLCLPPVLKGGNEDGGGRYSLFNFLFVSLEDESLPKWGFCIR